MRRASLIALAAAAFGAGATAASAGGPVGGRTVRVEVPPARRVFVRAGVFPMGISKDDRQTILNECMSTFDILNTNIVCTHLDTEMSHMELRAVFVSAFWIDRDEVTVADYRACVAGGGCPLDPLVAGDERLLVPRWPLVNVTWSEAQTYCRWTGGRLPTEAEWERAARGDSASAYPWGDLERATDFNHGRVRSTVERGLDRIENIDLYVGNADASDGAEFLAPVGSYKWGDGPFGTRDQAGNAAEWTGDAYVYNESTQQFGYDGLDVIDPYRVGFIGDPRVVRGGSWRQPTVVARSDMRDPYQYWLIRPELRYTYIGFRCVQPAR